MGQPLRALGQSLRGLGGMYGFADFPIVFKTFSPLITSGAAAPYGDLKALRGSKYVSRDPKKIPKEAK